MTSACANTLAIAEAGRLLGARKLSPLELLHDYLSRIDAVDVRTCDPLPFAHDVLGSHGFVVDGYGYRIG